MKKHRALKVGAWMLVLGAAGVTAAWFLGLLESPYSDDPQIAAAEQLREEVFAGLTGDESTVQLDGELRSRYEAMSAEQKDEFADGGRDLALKLIEADLTEFFALPSEQQQKRLDAQIDQIVRGRNAKLQYKSTGKSPFPTGSDTEEEKKKNRRETLDFMPPMVRGMMADYDRMLHKRMRERGL